MIKGHGTVKITETETIFEGFVFDGPTTYKELVDWAIARLRDDLAKTIDPTPAETGD